MDKWLLDVYQRADKVSCGVYIADFNPKHRMTKVGLPIDHKLYSPVRSASFAVTNKFIGYD